MSQRLMRHEGRGYEGTNQHQHQIEHAPLICSLPDGKMDKHHSARFRLARPGRHPGGNGRPGGCR